MNAPFKPPRTASLFMSNRNQAVRIPKDMEFPKTVGEVVVRKVGNSIVLTPKAQMWTDYFAGPAAADFPGRGPQGEYEERESF